MRKSQWKGDLVDQRIASPRIYTFKQLYYTGSHMSQSTHQNTNSSDSVNLSGKECVNSLVSQIGKLRFHLAGGLPNAVWLMGCGPSPSDDSQTSVGSFFTAIRYKHQGRKSINSNWTCWAESWKWTSNVSTTKNSQGLEQCWRHLPGLFNLPRH